MATPKTDKVPAKMQAIFDEIVALTDPCCTAHLNDEYAQLARQAAAALCRKRPSPLKVSTKASWACGIIYALGFVNFLFDKNNQPYLSAEDLCAFFGVSKSSGANYSKKVRDRLKMDRFDTTWCLPSQLDDHPSAWYLMVDGMIVDARSLPRELQAIAYEKGLIPYIQADREV